MGTPALPGMAPGEQKGKVKMKKALTMVLAAFMILLSLAGCAETSPAKGSATESSLAESQETPSPAAGDPRELTIAISDIGVENVSYADNLPIWQEVEKRLNLKINWEALPGDQYATSAKTRLASGQNLPDIMQVPGSVTDVLKYAKQGLLVKLNDLIEKDADMSGFLKAHPEIKSGITDPDGNIYFLTNYLLDVNNGMGMVLRKDWLDKLGMEIPTTLEDWEAVLEAFKTTDLNGQGAGAVVPFGGKPRYFYSAFGLTVQQSDEVYFYPDDSGKIKYDATRDEFKEYLAFASKLYAEGMLDPMFGAGQSQISDLINKNMVASTAANPGDCDNYMSTISATGVEGAEYVWTFTPVDRDGKNRWAPLPSARSSVFMGITKDCENPEVAMELLSYIWANEDGQRLSLMGLEGEHWDMVDGVPVFKDFMLNDPQYSIILMSRKIGGFSFLDIQTKEFNLARGVGEYKKGLELILANEDKYAEALPVFIPTEEESAEINSLWPDIKSYIDEMTLKFIMGTEPIESFDAFRQKLSDMGIDRLTEIYQTVYDRYAAAK